MTHIRGLLTPLMTAHEPPSTDHELESGRQRALPLSPSRTQSTLSLFSFSSLCMCYIGIHRYQIVYIYMCIHTHARTYTYTALLSKIVHSTFNSPRSKPPPFRRAPKTPNTEPKPQTLTLNPYRTMTVTVTLVKPFHPVSLNPCTTPYRAITVAVTLINPVAIANLV